MAKNLTQVIEEKLANSLRIEHLQVINESGQHSAPEGTARHFKAIIVSQDFNGLNRVQRHRRVYSLLTDEFKKGLHALSLETYTPDEWPD